jgi:two-component system, sensor histidine kinase and response regulator
MLVFLLAWLLISYRIVRQKVGSLVQLAQETRSIGMKNHVLQFSPDGNDEIARLSQAFIDTQEERDRYFDLSGNLLAIAGFDGYSRRVNQACVHASGYTKEQLLSQPFVEFVLPAHRPDAVEKLDLAKNGVPVTIESRMQNKDGSFTWVLWNITASVDMEEYYFSGQDITARKNMETELLRAQKAAESGSRAKSEFLANMSHEIRTPMNGVLGTVDLLLNSSLTSAQRELALLARASGETLLTIINDILDFSKIEAGKLVIAPVPFDLLQTVEEVGTMIALQPGRKADVNVIVRYPAEVPRNVIGDQGRIRQIMTNLTSNAIKFTEKGHVLIDVEVDTVSGEEALFRISIEDSGLGIAADKLEKLFDKFTQADSTTTRRYGGTGLGLAISKQLIGLMGGTIAAKSRVGIGSTFWFILPLPLQGKTQPVNAEKPVGLADVRVLIVDDNSVNRLVLQEQLRGWKTRIGSCASGAEALRMLRESHSAGNPYQIAILDYQMPEMDGEMLGRAIKADSLLREIPLIMLSSLGQDAALKERIKKVGFAAYLVKPARQSELLETLTSVWDARCRQDPVDLIDNQPPLTQMQGVAITENRDCPFAGTKVLLAEDNATNQVVGAMMLRNLGCYVEVAANGRKALEMIGSSSYDIVFMDCEMPEMDGYEAVAAIRRLPDGKSRLPVVAVTALAMQGDEEQCLRAGMDDYIGKPVKQEDFAAALKWWLPGKNRDRKGDSSQPVTGSEPVRGMNAPGELLVRTTRPEPLPALSTDVVARLFELEEATEPSLVSEIFSSFTSDSVKRIVMLRQALEESNAGLLREAAHALKGACATAGAGPMCAIAEQLEAAGRTGSTAGVRLLIDQIENEFERVKAEIDALDLDPGRRIGQDKT